jgi:nucleoside-diphosphate-sugar epimerase
MNILVTGMSGLIGGAVRRQLEGTCTLTALNRRPVDGVPAYRQTSPTSRPYDPPSTMWT